MKRRITILIVAALAVALCVTSLAACGTSASVKDLYELVFEAERADESVTTISAKELDFDNAMPTLLDGAVVFEETDGTDAVPGFGQRPLGGTAVGVVVVDFLFGLRIPRDKDRLALHPFATVAV